MLTRIITALVALAVFFAVIMLSPALFTVVASIVILIMVYECLHAAACGTKIKIAGYVSAVLLILGMRFGFYLEAALLSVAIFMTITVALHGKESYKEVLSAALLTFYVATFMGFVIKIRNEYSVYEMLIVFVCAWMTDTGAYFSGTFFGKHKLIEHVSPKKTVEGALGGILVCSLSCALYLFVVNKLGLGAANIGYAEIMLAGAVMSVMAQLGDLSASAVKRDCNVKDYGKIFPGHGGFMDRFDSVMFIAPFVYYFITLIV